MTDEQIKQYIFLRSDLPGYNCGMLAAQVSHVSVDVITRFYNHPDTQEYLSYGNSMTTVVFEIKEKHLRNLEEKLTSLGIEYSSWYENPTEHTCISPRPIRLKDFPDFKKLKGKFRLFRCTKD